MDVLPAAAMSGSEDVVKSSSWRSRRLATAIKRIDEVIEAKSKSKRHQCIVHDQTTPQPLDCSSAASVPKGLPTDCYSEGILENPLFRCMINPTRTNVFDDVVEL